MKINLITNEQHAELLNVFNTVPVLPFQNKGFQYIGKNNLTEDVKLEIKNVESILKNAIVGFRSFTNFRLSVKENKPQIRFDYNYNYDNNDTSFSGVGYILIDELLNGFNN
ncbi:MAG: hypothetical protein RL311_814 [Bacteroidota bacterium]|jgi:hypothetical protein